MGYNTTLVILNDALHEIENDKEFGMKVAQAARRVSGYGHSLDIDSGNHCNAATVVETHHADQIKLIAVGGNCGEDLGYVGNWNANKEQMLRSLAESMGFTVSKKRITTKSSTKNKNTESTKSTS